MIKPSLLFTLTFLLLFNTSNLLAQQAGKDFSIGLNAAYSTDHGLPGAGIQVKKAITPRVTFGVQGSFFIPENRNITSGFVSGEYEQKMWFASAFTQLEILSINSFNIYGMAGVLHQRVGYDGYTTFHADVPPLEDVTYEYDRWRHHTGPEIGTGIEYGKNLIFFAETSAAFLDDYLVKFNTGLRLNF